MWQYNLEIVLGKLDAEIKEFESLLQMCKIHYNQRSIFAKNKKEIVSMKIFVETNSVEIVLRSVEKLKYPLKGLHLFSSLIIKFATPEQLEKILYSNRTVLRLVSYTEVQIEGERE